MTNNVGMIKAFDLLEDRILLVEVILVKKLFDCNFKVDRLSLIKLQWLKC